MDLAEEEIRKLQQTRLMLLQKIERYDTTCYFNVRLKADMSRLNQPHGDDN